MKKTFSAINLTIFSLALFGCFVSTASAYSDVSKTHPYFNAIQAITDSGIMKGYADNNFRPNQIINRAELMKIIMLAQQQQAKQTAIVQPTQQTTIQSSQATTQTQQPTQTNTQPTQQSSQQPTQATFAIEQPTQVCFKDVPIAAWFAPFICTAKQQNLVTGYKDGTFKPEASVNAVEAIKMLNDILKITPPTQPTQPLATTTEWYQQSLNNLAQNNYLPASIKYLNQSLKRGEAAEILWRILNQNHTASSTTALQLQNNFCQVVSNPLPANIDMQKVRDTWLGWYNEVRGAQGLKPYSYNDQLARTAIIWSETAKQKGVIEHKRPGQTVYYDYNRMLAWFKGLGLEFKVIGNQTQVENINWGYYNCKSADCTQALITSIRTGFDFFYGEKNRAYRPHYESIMNKNYKIIGLGISIDEAKRRYYLTVHYGTEIISNPMPVCPL